MLVRHAAVPAGGHVRRGGGPGDPEADHAVRILTPDGELPLAGHPTLGTAHAGLAALGLRDDQVERSQLLVNGPSWLTLLLHDVDTVLGLEPDQVTGSLQAGIAQWLIPAGVLPPSYVAAQGTRLGRVGRAHLARVDGVVAAGGGTHTVVAGTAAL